MSNALSKDKFEIIAWKEFENGEYIQFPIELFVSDEVTDMAVFRFDGKDLKTNPKFSAIKPLKLADELPAIGAEVVAVGYYGDYRFPFHSAGRVSMIDKNEDIFADVTIIPGNSGAPLFSAETGEVVGITTSVLDIGRETVRFGIAKRASKLKDLLQRLEKKN
jgi:S1-C subfamily serine protease